MDDYDSLDTDKDPESDYLIDEITNDEKSLAYGLYSKLNAYQFHYNIVQNKYKKLASSWILASFLGIGYLLSGMEIGLPFHVLISIIFVAILASIGIILLWFLDTGIYHRLLVAVFVENIALEKKYPFLCSAHQNMRDILHVSVDPVFFHGLYYFSFVSIELIIATIAGSLYFYPISKWSILIIGVLFVLSVFCIRYLYVKITLESGAVIFQSKKKK